ncbi:MAG TPA: hypothetical protein VKK61_02380, partial [Tepidisphaeraceae bacterium]|nr:hypothetical protein [Tepidisphaeraceae bacterium]
MILIVTAVTVVPIVGAILYLAHLSTIDSQQTAEHDLASAAQNLAFSVEKWDESMVFALENLKNQPDIISMDPARQKPILMEMAKVYSRFSYIHIDIPSGLSIVRADDKSPIDYHDREWFKQAIGGKGVSRETLISRSVSRPAVTI